MPPFFLPVLSRYAWTPQIRGPIVRYTVHEKSAYDEQKSHFKQYLILEPEEGGNLPGREMPNLVCSGSRAHGIF